MDPKSQDQRRQRGRVPSAMRLSLVVLVFFSLLCSSPASGAWHDLSTQLSNSGWVTWPGPPASARPIWSQPLSGPVSGGPLVDAEGNLFIVIDEVIHAYSPDGFSLWQASVSSFCPRSAIIMDHPQLGRQIIVLTSHPRAIRAISAVSGDQTWVTALPATPVGPPMVGPNGHLYFITSDGRLRAFSAAGTALWTYSLGRVSSLPLARNAGSWVYAILDNGTVVAIDTTRRTLVWRCETGLAPISGPALGADGAVFFATATGHGVRISSAKHISWSLDLGTAGAPLITAEGDAIFAALDGSLTRISQDGTLLWTVDLGDAAFPQQPIGDGSGIVHVAVNGSLCRVSPQGAVLAPAFELPTAIEQVIIPAGQTAVCHTIAGTLNVYQGSTAPGPETDSEGACGWLPELLIPEPDGANGWYRLPPQIGVSPASLADWPSGLEIAWAASSPAGSQSGVLTADAADLTITLQGEVNLTIYPLGAAAGEGSVFCLAIDRIAPAIDIGGSFGGLITVTPGLFSPALDCRDAGSGVATIEMWLDGTALMEPCELSSGWHDLRVRASDRAGNTVEADYRVAAASPCAASSLNPVMSATLPTAAPFWSRSITVLLRLPFEAVAAAQPSAIEMHGATGVIAARLPVVRGAASRVYMVRFDRESIVAAVRALVAGTPAQRLVPLDLMLTLAVEDKVFAAPVRLIWRP